MERREPVYYREMEKCVDDIIHRVGKRIVFGMPLALGKPNQLVNALYARAKKDPEIHLTIMTALSLETPKASSELEQRFLGPLVERIWKGFVPFDYLHDMKNNNLPPNVEVKEFFTKAGGYLAVPHAQQNYISSNYTHAVRDLIDNGLNVIGNIVAKRQLGSRQVYSTSCNPDLILEAMVRFDAERKKGRKVLIVGQVNTNLPFMYGDAVVEPQAYDMIVDNREYDFELFSAPKDSVSTADYMVGLHVSALVKDGGTLQIGIGSLGDGIASGLILRHRQNAVYRQLIEEMEIESRYGDLIRRAGGTGPFDQGLYGATEMLVDVFMELYKNGVIRRKVYDHPSFSSCSIPAKSRKPSAPRPSKPWRKAGPSARKSPGSSSNPCSNSGYSKTACPGPTAKSATAWRRIHPTWPTRKPGSDFWATAWGSAWKTGCFATAPFSSAPGLSMRL